MDWPVISPPDAVIYMLLAFFMGLLGGINAIRHGKDGYEAWQLDRERQRYYAEHETRREDDLLRGEGTMALRGYFFYEDLLQRHCARRKAVYIEQLRYYRLYVLGWTTRRAAREAGIGIATYKRIEGKRTTKAQLDTVALICDAFRADAKRLGFADCGCYTDEEIAIIACKVDGLATKRRNDTA